MRGVLCERAVIAAWNLPDLVLGPEEDRTMGDGMGGTEGLIVHRDAKKSGEPQRLISAQVFEMATKYLRPDVYAKHHLRADAKFSRLVSSAVHRRAGNSNGALAWIASEGRTTGAYKGKPLDLLTTETMLLRRTNTGWRIVHIHWSSTENRGGG